MADGLLDGWDYSGAQNPVLYPNLPAAMVQPPGTSMFPRTGYEQPSLWQGPTDQGPTIPASQIIDPSLMHVPGTGAYALYRSALDKAADIALAFSGGGLGIKGSKPPAASDLAAPYIGKGTETPLFDYSRLTERPDVPQTPLERLPDPAKGIPDWFSSQINDPARREQYKAVLAAGRAAAGDPNALFWWNTFPLRERFIGEYGDLPGDARWRSDMNMWSATSPRTDFPQTIRQSSYFNNLLAEGEPLPELYKKYSVNNPNAFNWAPVSSAPQGYKNFPQHIMNIENLLQPDRVTLGNEYPLTNPKPAGMAQNLVGNWLPLTIDARDLRAGGILTKGGERMESVDPATLYGYTERNFHQPLAEELGFAPAQIQSGAWLGVPSYFKLPDLSGTNSALGTLEEHIRRTAASLGLTPEETLRRGFMGHEFKLLSAGGGLGLGVPGLLGSVDQNQGAGVQ